MDIKTDFGRSTAVDDNVYIFEKQLLSKDCSFRERGLQEHVDLGRSSWPLKSVCNRLL